MSSVIGNQFSVISEDGAQALSFCFCAGDLTCLSRAVVNRVACEDQGASQSRFCGDMSGLCFRAEARTRNVFTCLPVYLSTRLPVHLPFREAVPNPQSRERAEIVEEQHIPGRQIPSGHKGLVELVRCGIGDSHQPRQPGTLSAQSAQVCEREQSVAKRVPKFFDRKIKRTEARHLFRRDGRKSENDRHHQKRRKPAFQYIHPFHFLVL